ncbi:MAG: hypothetical protein KIT34_00005 [Cyanobacteria bacterium TGS_CYA1]|nr:hypothetical protein [Cyanobacteria bacterium TGS_CYA1]
MFLRRLFELIQNSQEQKLEKAKAKFQLHMWPLAGAKLTGEEVIRIEDSLKTNPKDLNAHWLSAIEQKRSQKSKIPRTSALDNSFMAE